MTTFEKLALLLTKHAHGSCELRGDTFNSQAQDVKAQLHVYGRKEVAIEMRASQQTYVVGIIQQKNFVGFYSMPVYSHPKLLKSLSADLKKLLKGKSCFHITDKAATSALLKEIDAHIAAGIAQYKKEGWV